MSNICSRILCSVGWNFVKAAFWSIPAAQTCFFSSFPSQMLDLCPGLRCCLQNPVSSSFYLYGHHFSNNPLVLQTVSQHPLLKAPICCLFVLECIFSEPYIFWRWGLKGTLSGGVISNFSPWRAQGLYTLLSTPTLSTYGRYSQASNMAALFYLHFWHNMISLYSFLYQLSIWNYIYYIPSGISRHLYQECAQYFIFITFWPKTLRHTLFKCIYLMSKLCF